MRRSRSQQGFTLIELMTVLAIIGILTFSLASLGGGSGAGTPRTFADRITGLIQLGRLRAEARRITHQVRVSTTSVALFESGAGTGLKAYSTVNETLVQSIDVPTGVTIAGFNATTQAGTGVTPSGSSLTFDLRADGQSPTGGTIYLADGAGNDKFRVFVYTITGAALARENW